jgi:hypothetical protein
VSFGKNPHVAKAETAEQKAGNAADDLSRARAWREAAHLWERAAERESDAKRREQYTARADRARANADAPAVDGSADPAADTGSKPGDPRAWN